MLNMLFGGPKGIKHIPSLNTLIEYVSLSLENRLNRENRSPRTLFWRGFTVSAIFIPLLVALGYGINYIAFSHPAVTAVCVFFVAKTVDVKTIWHTTLALSQAQKSAVIRTGIRDLIMTFSGHFVPVMILFLIGGFALLLPFHFLYVATQDTQKKAPSAYQTIFQKLCFIPSAISAGIAAFLLAFAQLFWPKALWQHAFKAFIKPMRPITHWPLSVITHGFKWSIEAPTASKKGAWIGPAAGSAKIKATDARDALIVTLLAFGLINGFVALLLLASWIR